MTDTFCIEPWTRVVVLPDGRVTPCCNWADTVGSLYRSGLSEIWNGESLRRLRSALARGEAHPACSACWREEGTGATSLRQRSNQAYRYQHGSLLREQFTGTAAESGYCTADPESYSFSISNICNLKCRSCHEAFSTRIGADRVHRAWGHERLLPAWRDHRLSLAPMFARGVRYHRFERTHTGRQDALQAQEGATIEVPVNGSRLHALRLELESPSAWRLRISIDGEIVHDVFCEAGVLRREFPLNACKNGELRIAFDGDATILLCALELERDTAAPPLKVIPANTPAWFADASSLSTLIERNSGEVSLSLLGGEPLLNDEIWVLLSQLVATGTAKRTTLAFYTNGTRRRDELARLAPAFRKVYVSVSIDGFGPLFEYLRYGARWCELLRNLQWLRTLPNVELMATPTLQNYNVLDCVRLFRFFDSHDIRFHLNILQNPARLHTLNLPPKVRKIAAARLRGYLEAECRMTQRAAVQSLVDLLESEGETFDSDLFREFMLFTNDLDSARRQRFADAAPDLSALIAAANVPWIDDLHHAEGTLDRPRNAMSFQPLLSSINRTVSPHDVIYPGFEATGTDNYFRSALSQLDTLDGQMRRHGHPGIRACGAVADYAAHYGRMTRALRVAIPEATIYACDIDAQAISFCEDELGARPVPSSWLPDTDPAPRGLDLLVCSSLLTHTGLDHWRRALRAWLSMVRPGGFVFFTYLSDAHLNDWRNGCLPHYGTYSAEQCDALERQLRDQGLGFAALDTVYSNEGHYGITLATADTVRAEARAAGFDVLDLVAAPVSTFGQDLAVLRRPPRKRRVAGENVQVIAHYEANSTWWTTLAAGKPQPPLPTDLGFYDARVAEVRDDQASLARAHGIDGFCVVCPLHKGRIESLALHDLLSSGRPDFPFCLMIVAAGEGEVLGEAEAEQSIISLLPFLSDARYIRVDDLPLLVVRGAQWLSRESVQQWRRVVVQGGLPGLHLCAVEFPDAPPPEEMGFDSLLESASRQDGSYAEIASASLIRAMPAARVFRSVFCRRHPGTGEEIDLYELWLRTVLESTHGHSGGPVFVHAWNDWAGGSYLEPDDRDGLIALAATRRAVTGPASGAVLLHKLRSAFGADSPQTHALLDELEDHLALRERSFSELGSLVEAAISTCAQPDATGRYLRVRSGQLRPAPEGFRFSIDHVGTTHGTELRRAVVEARRDDFRVAGWVYGADQVASGSDLLVVLRSLSTNDEFFFFLRERHARPDVVAALRDAHPDVPLHCGFDENIVLDEVPDGDYSLGLVQRSLNGTHCDFADFVLRLS